MFDHLTAAGEPELPAALLDVARRIEAIVPECIGLSFSVVAEGFTMTLLAIDVPTAQLDASQYLEDGPCLAAVRGNEALDVNVEDLLDEGRWLTYARLSAAFGVASSLSLPVTVDGEVVGGANLYASTPDAFEGRHEAVANALGTVAEWAVTNADLSFSTRLQAIEAAEKLPLGRDIDIAVAVIAEQHGVSIDEAHERLRRAAAQAGISETEAARALSSLFSSGD